LYCLFVLFVGQFVLGDFFSNGSSSAFSLVGGRLIGLPDVRFAPEAVIRSIRHRGVCSEPHVITALAQRWSGLFSHSAANAVAQLKS
jgi:hypothetical protein